MLCYNTGCTTRYRTRHFFNNFATNEDIATKFEADLPHCVRSVKEKNVLLFKFRCNIFIGVRIIKEMPGSVASGTLCIIGSRESAIGIATGYELDGPGIASRWGRGIRHQSRPALRPTQAPIQWVPSLSRG